MSRPTPNAIFKSVLERTADGSLLDYESKNHYQIYFNQLSECYGLPQNFRESDFIEKHKGEEIGLIANLALNFLNYHLLAKVISESKELSEIVNRTLGGHILENATLWTGGNLNHISRVIDAESLGENWREQAKQEHNAYWESLPPSQHVTTVIIGGKDE